MFRDSKNQQKQTGQNHPGSKGISKKDKLMYRGDFSLAVTEDINA